MRTPPVTAVRAATGVRNALAALVRHAAPPPVALLDLAFGFSSTQMIHTAARLGIADALDDGPLTAPDLADRVDADPDAMYRLLRACASIGVFRRRADGRFELNALARPLRARRTAGDAVSVRDAVLMLGDPGYQRPWGALEHAVRTGRPAAEHVFGTPMWNHLDEDPALNDTFNNAMTCISELETPAILAAEDFSRYHSIVDVGGGQGRLLAAVLAARPDATGVLLDLESVVRHACSALPAERTTVIAGSFFDAVPTGGDAYVLRRVLHDWNDHDAARILGAVHAAMPHDATLLVIDGVIRPGNAPEFGKLLDLDMMVFVGGRERTAEQVQSLLASAGFRLTKIVPTVAPVSILHAVPA